MLLASAGLTEVRALLRAEATRLWVTVFPWAVLDQKPGLVAEFCFQEDPLSQELPQR